MGRSLTPPITPDIVTRVLELRADGEKLETITAMTPWSQTTVFNIIHGKFYPEHWKSIRRILAAGLRPQVDPEVLARLPRTQLKYKRKPRKEA